MREIQRGQIQLKIPGHQRCTASRTDIMYDALLPQYKLADAISDPGSGATLRKQIHEGIFGPRYRDHQVVRENPNASVADRHLLRRRVLPASGQCAGNLDREFVL